MSNKIICPACNTENYGTALKCSNCQTSLEGVPPQIVPETEDEFQKRQNAILNQRVAKAEEKIKAENMLRGKASNFFWIAGLSIVNSVVSLLGGGITFVIGLAITQIVDGVSMVVAEELTGNAATILRIAAFVVNLLIAGLFALFGFFASKQKKWAFLVGMILYLIDGILSLIFKDYMGFAFHLFLLIGLFSGYRALLKTTTQSQEMTIMNP